MKVQFPITMPHELAVAYKEACRKHEIAFSELVRFALEELGPVDSTLTSYIRAKRFKMFKGTYTDWRERDVVYEYKGQHKHPDGAWCGKADCAIERVPLD